MDGMAMSRAVMQQALEALEKVKTDADKQPPVYPWDIWRMWVDRAITNLRAALAEPEQPVALSDERIDFIADTVVKGMPEGISGFCKSWGWRQFARAILQDCAGHYAPTPQPEQEPVAWMQEMPVSGNEERSVRMTTVKMVADEWDNPIPLYTAPTPRTWVGLTDEEIDVGLCRSPYALQTAQAWRDGVEWAQEQLKEKNA
jgi:hypothetical protein